MSQVPLHQPQPRPEDLDSQTIAAVLQHYGHLLRHTSQLTLCAPDPVQRNQYMACLPGRDQVWMQHDLLQFDDHRVGRVLYFSPGPHAHVQEVRRRTDLPVLWRDLVEADWVLTDEVFTADLGAVRHHKFANAYVLDRYEWTQHGLRERHHARQQLDPIRILCETYAPKAWNPLVKRLAAYVSPACTPDHLVRIIEAEFRPWLVDMEVETDEEEPNPSRLSLLTCACVICGGQHPPVSHGLCEACFVRLRNVYQVVQWLQHGDEEDLEATVLMLRRWWE